MTRYYTDREHGALLRTIGAIDERLWGGLYSLIERMFGFIRMVLKATGRGG